MMQLPTQRTPFEESAPLLRERLESLRFPNETQDQTTEEVSAAEQVAQDEIEPALRSACRAIFDDDYSVVSKRFGAVALVSIPAYVGVLEVTTEPGSHGIHINAAALGPYPYGRSGTCRISPGGTELREAVRSAIYQWANWMADYSERVVIR